jgi:hypothetical protein
MIKPIRLEKPSTKKCSMNMFEQLTLPNGSVIANRIAKAAMEENMADADQAPSEPLMRLYQSWADGEAGLILTGNVMVDGRAVTGPGGVVLENDRHLDKFKRWPSSVAVGERSSGSRSTIRAARCRLISGRRPGRRRRCRWISESCPGVSPCRA